MKLLLENWRKFLNEEQESSYQIYCDMDGVLVDFEQGVVEQINLDLQDESLPDRKPTGGITKIGKLRKALAELGLDSVDSSHIKKIKGPINKVTRPYMYATFGDNEKFWSNLPWMPGGEELWAYISQFEADILTSPMGPGSETGKQIWIDNNLNPAPKEVFMSHDKYEWATSDENPNILIDDFTSNTIPWEDAGGIAILHTKEGGVSATIEKLKEIFGQAV